jgi:hypothetical protein
MKKKLDVITFFALSPIQVLPPQPALSIRWVLLRYRLPQQKRRRRRACHFR